MRLLAALLLLSVWSLVATGQAADSSPAQQSLQTVDPHFFESRAATRVRSSQPVETPQNFTRLLPSWIVRGGTDANGVRFQARVRMTADGRWSPWFDFGYWGHVSAPGAGDTFEAGELLIDVLHLNEPADAWQVRYLRQGKMAGQPAVARMIIATRGSLANDPQSTFGTADWHGDLAPPFLPQMLGGPGLMSDICSPTSVAMALSHFGKEVDVADHARLTYDDEYKIFGNWNRAIAAAGQRGVDGHLEYFTSWQQLAEHLKAGRLVVASVAYEDGEADSFIDNETNGHLILIRGLTPDGDVIVNDPGSTERGEAAVYKKADFERAWLINAEGVGYVLGPGGR